MSSFVDRMVRAARLDVSVFEEVEADRTATGQALGVVVLSSVASAIGLGGGPAVIAVSTVVALAGWYVWAFLTYFIGTRLLPEPATSADQGELLRTVGFAVTPGILRVIGVVPMLRSLAFLVAAIWMLVAVVVAVRQALDYRSTWRAIAVCVIGWAVQWAVIAIIFTVLGVHHAS